MMLSKFKYAGVVERSNTTDCKSVGFGLRGFESLPLHQTISTMKHHTIPAISLFLAIVLAGALLASTALIPRQGNPLTYIAGQDSHRDVRGVPFVFLKRSVGDGQCDLQDQKSGKCNPDTGNEPHQILIPYLAIDAVFWLTITLVPTILILRKRKE